jgi:hypothetical protein
MKRLPDIIRAVITIGGSPAAGLAVSTSIKTTRKNPFGFIWGPSDAVGIVRIDRAELFGQAEAERREFIMDYGHPEHDGAGLIEVAVENTEGLDRALKACDQFSQCSSYPDGYQAMLKEARSRTVALAKVRPRLTVEAIGGDCQVVAVQEDAG